MTLQLLVDDQKLERKEQRSRVRIRFGDQAVLKAIRLLQLERGPNAPIPSFDIADRADVCRNTVFASVKRLERAGVLEHERAGGYYGSFYRIYDGRDEQDDELAYA